MANNFVLSDILSKEYIQALYDHMIVGGLVNTQYTTEFTNPKRGQRVRVKRAVTFKAYEWEKAGDTVVQDIDETANYISIDKMLDVTFAIETKDWTFEINAGEFIDRILKPAVIAIAEEADSHIIRKMYEGTQKVVPGVTSNISSVADLAKLNKAAKQMKIGKMEATALIGLETEATMLGSIPELIHADKRADDGFAFRNANVGYAMNVAYYSSEKVDDLYEELGTSTLVDGVATVKVAASKYDEQIILEGADAGETIAAGQVLKVGNFYFTAKEDAVATAGGDIIVKTVGLNDDIPVSANTVSKVVVGGNFLFARDAVALVTVVPALPQGASMAQVLTDDESGLGVRMVVQYDGGANGSKSDIFTLDTYVAAKVMDPRRIARF